MHPSAKVYGEKFLEKYSPSVPANDKKVVVEVGAGVDIDRNIFNIKCGELGLEYHAVDQLHSIDPEVAYTLPMATESVDIVVSSSSFEHDDFFWITFLEIMRILKPHGLFYLNAPTNGAYHKYPVDNWRFYADSSNALVNWARKNRFPAVKLESFEGELMNDQWIDHVAVILKNEDYTSLYTNRIR